MQTISLDAAHNLVDLSLIDGWKVIQKVEKEQNATGGHFSVSYLVQNEHGKKAFLKVLDLGKALSMPGDQLKNIQFLIQQFDFERETLRVCREYRLRRVASAIADGKLEIAGNPFGVYYIIFELAEGDIRKKMGKLQTFDIAWVLRTLHHISVAINQLHRKGIAHQDLKPSNVLVFGPKDAKVSDLGCADFRDKGSPRGVFTIAGDRGYAPPELLYGEVPVGWDQRRLGTDMYLFGSLITFFFTQVTTTALLVDLLPPAHRPGLWPHDYRTVLPYVRDAFGRMMEQIRQTLPLSIRDDLAQAIELLCDPDPQRRGHPRDLNSFQFNFERFVSLFDRLATRAEYGLFKH